jgi:hypothetical protein
MKIELSPVSGFIETIQRSLELFREFITAKMKNILHTDFFIEVITLKSRKHCRDFFVSVIDVYLNMTIFIDGNVYRDQLEQKLINLTEFSFAWNMSNILSVTETTNLFNMEFPRNPPPFSNSNPISSLKQTNDCLVTKVNDKQMPNSFTNVFVSPLLTCPQVLLTGNETGLDWRNIPKADAFSDLTPYLHYTLDKEGIRVCASSVSYIQKLKSKVSNNILPLTIVTLTCLIISLICLIVTLLTYCMFSSLRTLPGINNMFLVASLFVAQLLMIIRPFFRSLSLVAVSVLSHWSWLSTFLWLQVCSFHMFSVFSAQGRSSFQTGKGRKQIIQYSSYAFGFPTFIVASNLIISLIVTNGEYTGYDKLSTLMTYKSTFITTLIIPLAFVSVTNVIFYIVTAYKIYSSPKVENTTGNRLHFGVYVKLFTLTGLSWVLQIIDTFLELSAFSYVVAILNGLQGMFIFVSYICNRRVWKMYAKLRRTDTVHKVCY